MLGCLGKDMLAKLERAKQLESKKLRMTINDDDYDVDDEGDDY